MNSVLRVLVVDDYVLIAEGLAALMKSFQPALKTNVAGNAREALQLIATTAFSLVFIDARMPGTSGIELIKTLRKEYPTLKIVGMTSYAQNETIVEMMQSGVDGLLLKSNAHADELKLCLDTVLAGSSFVSEEVRHLLNQNNSVVVSSIQFTKREQELLKLLCAGLSSKEIAEHLNLKTSTIEDYRKTMLQKANCKNIAELTAFAFKNGIIV